MLFGLSPLDLAVIAAYFALVMAVGFWVARKVKNETDFFLGGRRFGKGLLIMHWLCTGTHSEMAVQVAGATARVGLGGIWYQWMWLFSTPFYWFIAPVMRRLRVMTTGDVFRIRYGRSLELLYSLVAAVYFVLSIAALIRGAAKAIAGATGGAVPTQWSVILLSVLFSTYIMAGGLVSAAYTDLLQGVLIVVLSVMLVPAGLAAIGGVGELHRQLPPAMFSLTAPPGAEEGSLWFVLAMSVLGLVGIVAQPHVMTATGSGKTETEARVGMCYGNFIKRLLTVAWAFTGLIALVKFHGFLDDVAPSQQKDVSEQLFGQAVRTFLGDGWRGLMIACLVAGVTGAETFMVVGSAIFTRNVYVHAVPGRSDRHYLWVGRVASGGILAVSIAVALAAESVTDLFVWSVRVISLLGAAFWLGAVWRRANAAGAWASFLGSVLLWAAMDVDPRAFEGIPLVAPAVDQLAAWSDACGLRGFTKPMEIFVLLVVQFGLLIVVSLCTRHRDPARLDWFFARLLTPVGQEPQVHCVQPPDPLPEAATLGMEGALLDYRKASAYGYGQLQRWGLEVPRFTLFDWGGFLAAWVFVGLLLVLLVWLAAA